MRYGTVVGLIVAAVCGGCAGTPQDSAALDAAAAQEDVGSVESAIGEQSCGSTNLVPDASLVGNGDAVNVLAGYDNANCDKTYVFQVRDFVAGGNKQFSLTWSDTKPANEIVCENSRLRMDTYRLVGGVWVFDTTKESWGLWQNNQCSMGSPSRIIPNSGTWRAVVQGIWNVQGTPTHRVRFQTT